MIKKHHESFMMLLLYYALMNRNTFEKYVQEFCEDLALKDNFYAHRSRHACVLTYENVIISSGININLKNDFTKKYNELKGIHAESLAIMRAIPKHHKILPYCELWVCRNNTYSHYSKPCPMCLKIIHSFGIKTIHYTMDNGKWTTMNV